ncbi:hypothetical protein SPD48_01580 [Pseudogracilibacillus sp. SE30717A]|uniref:hypothetical protein n=1 Tax=Pseudogracilibacillus sp. SE30717A TaxID=3098293 RepID=UPI00300E6281
MLERILRSPLLMISILIYLGIVYVGVQEGWSKALLFYPFLISFLIYFAFVYIHNKRNPDKRIKWITYIPYELREDDEGLQWITFKATRKVYIFYSFAIPIGIVLYTFFHEVISYFTIWMLVGFGIIQYLIYWLETKDILKGEE